MAGKRFTNMANKPVAMVQGSSVRAGHCVIDNKNAYLLATGENTACNCGVSFDMRDKHVEQLEQKYAGGGIETQQAAHIIQYNFKQYTLSKNFQRLRSTHDELRIQRLMTDISSDKDSVWSDVAVTSQPVSSHAIVGQHPRTTRREHASVASSSPPPSSPDSFQIDDDSQSYVRSHSVSDSRLHDVKLQYSDCTGRPRKRQYRIGLNLFNKKPERGVKYLMEQRFLANSSRAVAEFLLARKGLSKQMIGEYLGNLQSPFNQDVLLCVVQELRLIGLDIDQALRKLIHHFRLPGEAQKIERIVERFSQWYCICNPSIVNQFKTVDTVFLIAYAIIMLNTDLHNPNIKPVSKMKLSAFIKNLKGIDRGKDVPADMLSNIYHRILSHELRVGPDHVSQVRKVERTMVGKIPQLAIPERRLVCYCRLYEIADPSKKEKVGLHQREIFLFNDVLVITKIYAKKKDTITYTYRRSIMIEDVIVQGFANEHYQYGIKLVAGHDRTTLICFNARNNHDREKFVDDLIDSITELKEMRLLQIGYGLRRRTSSAAIQSRISKDSGVADLEAGKHLDTMYMHSARYTGAGEGHASSLTELHVDDAAGLTKSQSSRSVDSCVISRKTQRV